MTPRQRLAENPFFVLGVPPETPPAEVERAGQRWLAELELGRVVARSYATPFGRMDRTPELVRAAVAELREPGRRLVHEIWARVPVRDCALDEGPRLSWAAASRLFGSRPR